MIGVKRNLVRCEVATEECRFWQASYGVLYCLKGLKDAQRKGESKLPTSLMLVTRKGTVKKMTSQSFTDVRRSGIIAIRLDKDDQLKAALVAAGLVNIAIYEFWAKASVQGLAPGAPMPPRAKVAGALSLGIWVGVAACGRSIAYF